VQEDGPHEHNESDCDQGGRDNALDVLSEVPVEQSQRCDTACDANERLLDEGGCRNVSCNAVFRVGHVHLAIKAQPLSNTSAGELNSHSPSQALNMTLPTPTRLVSTPSLPIRIKFTVDQRNFGLGSRPSL